MQKSESKFIKKVKMKYGEPEDVSILLGDWASSSMPRQGRYHAPCKVEGFRKMFKRAGYGVYLVDEHLNSSVCPGAN